MPSIAFHHIASYIYEKHTNYFTKCNMTAHERVKEHYKKNYDGRVSSDGEVDIDVTFDGSWLRRGHKSHIGVAFVVEVDLGLALDCVVLSNWCSMCAQKKKRSPNSFDDWKKNHKCQQNFNGKSGAMEVEGAVRLWKNSTSLGFRYVTFVGDGDSAAYRAVCAMNDQQGPYNVPVKKEECVNHVSKRMGTRLRKLKKQNVTPVQTKTGKTIMRSELGGAHMLADGVIDKLTSFYGKAIRENINSDEEAMRRAVWASFLHSSATKDSSHMFCPKGKESWCW